jgi:hypothetical protein
MHRKLECRSALASPWRQTGVPTSMGGLMRMRWGGLLVLVLLCSGCATAGTDESKSLSRRASGEARPVIVGTAPGGSTRYHGAGEIVGKDTLSVFAVEGHTRLQIGYGEKLSQIDLDDSARLRLIEGLRKTFPICDSAKKGEIKGVTVIDTILGSSGYSADSRGLLELAFSAIVLPDGSISCADILALKKSGDPSEKQKADDYAAIHALAFSALPHLIDVLERIPSLGKMPSQSPRKF